MISIFALTQCNLNYSYFIRIVGRKRKNTISFLRHSMNLLYSNTWKIDTSNCRMVKIYIIEWFPHVLRTYPTIDRRVCTWQAFDLNLLIFTDQDIKGIYALIYGPNFWILTCRHQVNWNIMNRTTMKGRKQCIIYLVRFALMMLIAV